MYISGVGNLLDSWKGLSMMRRLAILQFFILILFTVSLAAAQQYAAPSLALAASASTQYDDNRVVNAVQDQKISQLERAVLETNTRMNEMAVTMKDLAGAVTMYNGIGIGFLGLLTILQGFRVLIQHKERGVERRRSIS